MPDAAQAPVPTKGLRHPWLRTPFVGRETECAALRMALAASPFVCVVGAPGIGKSRLVVQVAAEAAVAARFGPLRMCSLTGARGLDDAAAAFVRATALAVGAGPAELVCARAVAAAGPAVWLLDDADALGPALAPLLERLAFAAPEARFVFTARTADGPVGVRIVRVGPLPTPATDTDEATVRASAAVVLLCAHLDAAGLGERTAPWPALSAIARAVEGVPLALELAAARLRTMTPAALAAELEAHRAMLGDGLTKHIAWAWAHLDTPLRDAMGALSVCRGGCDRALARAVVGGPAADADRLIDALVEHSWLRPTGAGNVDGADRLAPFESMRAFAAQATPEDALAAARDRHARALAQAWVDAPIRARSPEGLAAVAVELPNLEAAFAWVAGPGGARGAVHEMLTALTPLTLALDGVLTIRGPADRLEAILTAARGARATLGPADAARLADAEGRHAINRGELDRAVRTLDEAVAQARTAGDEALLGRALDHRACAEMLRHPAAAVPLLEEALRRSRTAGDRAGEGRTLSNLGICRHAEGRMDEARALLEEALVRLRAGGDALGAANTWSVLGALYHDAPGQDLARACYASALEIYRAAGNVRREGAVTGSLALLEQEAGHLDRAAALHDAAIARLRQVDAHLFAAVYAGYRGTVEHERGAYLAARLAYRDAIARLRTCGDVRFTALFTACLSAAEAADGHTEVGVGAGADAEAARPTTGDRTIDTAVAVLRAAAGAVTRAEGAHEAPTTTAADRAGLIALAAPARAAYDVRLALRLARPLLTPEAESNGIEAVRPRASTDALLVTRDGTAFRAPGSDVADLGRRMTQRRLLQRLVAERVKTPGRPLSPEVLFEAGWPGDRSRRTAALNRVHVALATLRTLGLRSLLIRRGGGYLLDPDVPLTLVDALEGPRAQI
ncbi:tetratricopeptide repeat protein [Myxococcota bacterium]|nr:tetratricopeptide repeat protein [Myxococcota bacterium]